MADNVLYREPGSGTTFATDEVASAHFQKVKVADGTDGGTNCAEVVTQPFTGRKCLAVSGGPTDPISDIPVFIDFPHHQVHEGETYRSGTLTANVGSGTSVDIRLQTASVTPTTQTPHMIYEVVSTGEAWSYIYEDSTFSNTGTAAVWRNRNRDSTNTSQTEISIAPTVSNTATLLWEGITGSGVKAGGESRDVTEWVLGSNRSYLLRTTSKASGNNIVQRVLIYEDLGV